MSAKIYSQTSDSYRSCATQRRSLCRFITAAFILFLFRREFRLLLKKKWRDYNNVYYFVFNYYIPVMDLKKKKVTNFFEKRNKNKSRGNIKKTEINNISISFFNSLWGVISAASAQPSFYKLLWYYYYYYYMYRQCSVLAV